MCKIAIIPHIKQGTEEQAYDLAIALTPYMTKNDSDGFGIASLGDNGLFTERWTDVNDAWMHRDKRGPVTLLDQAFDDASDYAFTGTASSRTYALMLHARMATTPLGINNTHPFMSDDGKTALIHNGVIHNATQLGLKNTTCDSEAILLRYQDYDMANNLLRVQDLADDLVGYYACGVFSNSAEGWILDIFKDTGAQLSAVYVNELETYVYCTRAEFVIDACADVGLTVGKVRDVKANVAIRYNALTGEVLDVLTFEGRAAYQSEVRHNWSEYDSGELTSYERKRA